MSQAGVPLQIVVYSDFECGACEKFYSQVEPELRQRYVASGKAEIDVRVLGVIGDSSTRAAEAALVAGDQGHFMEFEGALFAAWLKEGSDAYSEQALINLATSLGMDGQAVKACLDDGCKASELKNNLDMAETDGVHVLPAVVVDGVKIEGFKPLQTYVDVIDQALKNEGSK